MPRFHAVLLPVLLAAATASGARAVVWYVGGHAGGDGRSWPSAFQTIQQGVDAARAGDEVWVAITVNSEMVTISRPDVALYGGFRGTERRRDQRLGTLRWPGTSGPTFRILPSAKATIVDGFTIARSQGRPGMESSADDVTIRHNEFRDNNAPGWQGGGLRCTGRRITIADNLFTDNMASGGGGMYVWAENGRILRNIVQHNTADNLGQATGYCAGGGMFLQGEGMEVRDNVVAWNTAVRYFAGPAPGYSAEGGGIYAGGEIAFINNTLAHNSAIGTEGARGGGFSFNYGTLTLANNISYRDNVRTTSENPTAMGGGIYFPTGQYAHVTVTFRANYFYDDFPDAGVPDGTDTLFGYFPQFVSETNFHLTAGSPLIDIGSNEYLTQEDRDADGGPRLMGQTVDIGAYEFGTPATAPTLTHAYVRPDGDDRNNGATWETARRSVGSAASITKPGGEIWVAGGTYVERIRMKAGMSLYGGFTGTETSVADRDARAHPTVLDGDRKGTVVTIPKEAGGAILDGFTIRHGSGTVLPGLDTAGGGVYSTAPSVVLANNVIEENHLFGGGMPNWLVGAGGGANLGGNGLLVIGNIVRNNSVETYGQGFGYAAYASAIGGGLYVESDFAAIVNNLFTGNSVIAMGLNMQNGGAGAGLYPVMSGGVIAGNTIADNTAMPGFGGTYPEEQMEYASPQYSNNIIAFNTGSVITGYGLPYFRNNLVFGNERSRPATSVGRNGNIAANPLFVDRTAGDYRLSPVSPAIDAGDSSAAFTAVDLDGGPRLQGASVDIGAYEWTPGGTLTAADAAAALRIAAGLSSATPDLLSRLNVDAPGTTGIDIRDAARLLREATY